MRSFVAVDVEASDPMRRLLGKLERAEARLSVVSPENLHVTLKFLGEVDEGRTEAIVSVLEAAAQGLEPFVLSLKGTGAFPRPTSPRVVWIGVGNAEPLVGYARRLEDGLEDLGFERESREFHAHVTVARVKGSRGRRDLVDLIEAHREEAFGEQRVEAVRLKKSELRPTGPVYSDVATVSLA